MQKEYIDHVYNNISQEEAVLKNEAIDNSYIIVEPHKMAKFPYIFLGIIRCIYELENVKEISEGVGMLIGSDIILTSAHNLCNKNSSGNILFPDKIEFIPGCNGIFNIYPNMKCKDYCIPKQFLNLKEKDENEEILNYDYGIVFLEKCVGDEVIKIFGNNMSKNILSSNYYKNKYDEIPKDDQELKLFNFLENNINFYKNYEISKIRHGLSKFKISMVSYTKYNYEFLKCPLFKYNSIFNILNKKFLNLNLDHLGKVKSHSVVGKKYTNNQKIISSSNDIKINSKTQIDSFLNSVEETNNINSKYQHNTEHKISSVLKINELNIDNSPSHADLKNSQKYVIFNEKKNLNFLKFYEDDQIVLCEAKGKLCNYNFTCSSDKENENVKRNISELRYLITTYGGQSGSPIFLRKKDKNLNGDNNSEEYILIGIHSRCPMRSIISNNTNFIHRYLNEEDSYKDINNVNDPITNDCQINGDRYKMKINVLNKNNDINYKRNEIRKNVEANRNNNELNHQHVIENSFLSKTAVSDYNIGLKLTTEILEDIKQMIRNKRKEFRLIDKCVIKSDKENIIACSDKSEYVFLNCNSHDKYLFSGIFHKKSVLINLFRIAEIFLEIPVVFIILQYGDNKISFDEKDNISMYNLNISDMIKEDGRNQDSFISKFTISINVNIDKYGDSIARKLINKLNDIDDEYEEDKIKKKGKVKIYNIIKYIFNEIQFIYNKSEHLHGLLFKTVRDKIFEYCDQI